MSAPKKRARPGGEPAAGERAGTQGAKESTAESPGEQAAAVDSNSTKPPRWTPDQTARSGWVRIRLADVDRMQETCPDFAGALSMWWALNRSIYEARGQESGAVQVELKYLATKCGCRYRKAASLITDLLAAKLITKTLFKIHGRAADASIYTIRNFGKKPPTVPPAEGDGGRARKGGRGRTRQAVRPVQADEKRILEVRGGGTKPTSSRTSMNKRAKKTDHADGRGSGTAHADAAVPPPPPMAGKEVGADAAGTVKPSLPPERYRAHLARVAKLRESLPSMHDGPGWTERYKQSQTIRAEISKLEAETVRLEAEVRAYHAARATGEA